MMGSGSGLLVVFAGLKSVAILAVSLAAAAVSLAAAFVFLSIAASGTGCRSWSSSLRRSP